MCAPIIKSNTVNHMGRRTVSVLDKFGTTTGCVISQLFRCWQFQNEPCVMGAYMSGQSATLQGICC